MGDVLLGTEAEALGRVRGRISWQGEGVRRGKVLIRSLDSEALSVVADVDVHGFFSTAVPAGRYGVQVSERRERAPALEVDISPGDVRDVDLQLPPPKGSIVTAGKGRTAAVGPGLRQGLWQSFEVPDGLPSSTVQDIIQDRSGHLWIGTGDGLSRYDGVTFTTFTTADGLPHNNVLVLLQDREGDLWIGSEKGLARYDGKTFTTFTREDGLADDYVLALLQDREGDLWIGTGRGISRYDGRHFATFTMEDGLVGQEVHSILEDRDGYLWIGAGHRELQGGNGVNRYDGQKFTTFTKADGLVGDQVHALLQDREGDLWIGTSQGVSRYDGGSFATVATRTELGAPMVTDILEDRQGDLWFAVAGPGDISSDGGGVVRYDGQRFTRFMAEDGLGGNRALAIFEDDQDYLWFGTFRGGMSRYAGGRFAAFTTADGLVDADVKSLLEDDQGRIWIGTQNGVSRYDGIALEPIIAGERTGRGGIRALLEDGRGDIWVGIGGGSGMSRYDGDTFERVATGDWLGRGTVNALLEDDQRQIWVSSGDNGGAILYDGTHFTRFTTEDGLASDAVHALAKDNLGCIWLGSSGGLSRYRGSDLRAGSSGPIFTSLTTEDGLAESRVNTILVDRRNHLWLGTPSGISRYDGQVFQNLYRHDGLVHPEVRDLIEDRHGDVWIATAGGVTRYTPNRNPFSMHLTKVTADREYGPVERLSLPASQHYLVFQFASDRLTHRAEEILYRYRLEGYQEDWQQTRTERVEYTDLPPGKYTFVVEGIDLDLNYSAPVWVALTVLKSWYKSGLKIALLSLVMVVVGGVSLGSSWYYYRQRQEAARLRLQMQEQEHQARVQLEEQNTQLARAKEEAEQASRAKSSFLAKMSHEIRTPMNAILGYAQILEADVQLDDRHRKEVETIGRSGEHLLSLINEVLDFATIEAGRLELRPTDFDLTDMLVGLGGMFELRCREKELAWVMDGFTESLQVHADGAKLGQVLINLLGNAVKFTPSGQVRFKFEAQGQDRYYFEVSDTGNGVPIEKQAVIFEPFQQDEEGLHRGGTGLGLAISRQHVALMGGQLELESTPGEGARFFFTLTLPTARIEAESEVKVPRTWIKHLAAGFSVRALVVDDQEANRDILARMLTRVGVQVETAESGAQALEQVRLNMPDILFMDIRMPVLNGMQTLQQFFDQYGRGATRVVAVTASVFEHQRQEYQEAGFDAFINKPIRIEEVYACLAAQLGVEYEHAEALETPVPDVVDWTGVVLPQILSAALATAAEEHSITQLQGHLAALEKLGAKEQALAAHLRLLGQQYDMQGIQTLLGEIDRS